jgi:hypothetical protein
VAHRPAICDLDRVVFPQTGTTKAELPDHYVRVTDVMLPHLRGGRCACTGIPREWRARASGVGRRAAGGPVATARDVELGDVLRRVEDHGDLFAGVLHAQQTPG